MFGVYCLWQEAFWVWLPHWLEKIPWLDSIGLRVTTTSVSALRRPSHSGIHLTVPISLLGGKCAFENFVNLAH